MINPCPICGSTEKKDYRNKYCSKACVYESFKGSGNPMFKNAKLSSTCIVCHKDFTHYEGTSSGKYCSAACSFNCSEWRKKQSDAKIKSFEGEPHRKIKARIRSSKEYARWRLDVIQRDNYKCRKCGSGQDVIVHHELPFSAVYREVAIDGFKNLKPLFDLDIGTTLCEPCHEAIDTTFTSITHIPQTRLIKALERNYEKADEGYKAFPDYYKAKMEAVIDHFKTKLD